MNAIDRALLWAGERLLRSRAGAAVVRGLHVALSRIAPFTPASGAIAPERARARASVEIRPSTISSAGLGLFALAPVEEDVIIGEYVGDTVASLFQILRLRDLSYLALGEPAIDAANHPEVMMRYVCHHPSPEKCNVEFWRDDECRVYFRTTKAVAAGDEFFIDYGGMFWAIQGVDPSAS